MNNYTAYVTSKTDHKKEEIWAFSPDLALRKAQAMHPKYQVIELWDKNKPVMIKQR